MKEKKRHKIIFILIKINKHESLYVMVSMDLFLVVSFNVFMILWLGHIWFIAGMEWDRN